MLLSDHPTEAPVVIESTKSVSPMRSKSSVQIDFVGDAWASFNKASTVTKDDARPVLDFLSSGFQTTWFQERSPRLWLALLKPKERVRDHFLLSMEYLLIGHGFPQDF